MNRLLIVAAAAALSSAAGAQTITTTLTEWKIGLSRDTVRAGAVTFQITNNGAMNHALGIIGNGVDKSTREVKRREGSSLTVTLKAGTYEVYCPMSEGSHKMAGMTRTLVVIPRDSTPPVRKPGA